MFFIVTAGEIMKEFFVEELMFYNNTVFWAFLIATLVLPLSL